MMDGTTTIKIDYYEELKANSDKWDALKENVSKEYERVKNELSSRTEPSATDELVRRILKAYEDGLKYALGFTNV